ncbi:GAF domain-containing protein [Dactylosporangium roseum]|uniref:histidine kinase n=1 Tax=Dactylosporangium roseum TaxID=47989 RepID=A0ABY5ZFT9_9ACTN|nr:GAF domain-containing protein [Dactylosporangium roseum]UWZ39612.1 GAF domain-containing protein [Dactylosporangium roseum]
MEAYQEADFLAVLSRLMLYADDLRSVLPEVSRRLARQLRLPFAAIELDSVPGDGRRVALPLLYRSRPGTLLVPADLPEPTLQRLRERLVPQLETLLAVATEYKAMARSLRTSRDELHDLAQEQAGLQRVAVLVASGAPPADVVAGVVAEAAVLLDADATRLMRSESAGTVTVLAGYGKPGTETWLGRRFHDEGDATELMLRTSRPARVDSYDDLPGAFADLARRDGFTSSVAAPITVGGRLWGSLVVLWSRWEPPPPGAEERLAQFAEGVATAVANIESGASRARIVRGVEEGRRHFEHDVHDIVQQRLVSLGLELRAAEALVPDELDELKARLSHTVEGLTSVFEVLQEMTRGIHPAILTQAGLMPALKALARRSAVPVTISPGPEHRLPRSVEVAAYDVVGEVLANTAEDARASSINVDVDITVDHATGRELLVVSIHDDGVGEADLALGTELVGLTDWVEAHGGRLQISRPAGRATSLCVMFPTDIDSERFDATTAPPPTSPPSPAPSSATDQYR